MNAGGGSGEHESAETIKPLVWAYDIPILTNRFMLWDFLLVFGFSALAFEGIFFFATLFTGDTQIFPLQYLAILLGIIAVVLVFAVLVVYQNRFGATFAVDSKGAWATAGRKERTINRVAMVVALASRKPQPIGASLLAYSQEQSGIRWEDVRRVTVHRRSRVISLGNSWRTVLRIYCRPDNFDKVLEQVERYSTKV